MMPATQATDFFCNCRAMALDTGAARVGSSLGDNAILTYRKAGLVGWLTSR